MVDNMKMKTEEEIREEIKALEKTIDNYREAKEKGKIDMEAFRHAYTENSSMIAALHWVLGENDRFD